MNKITLRKILNCYELRVAFIYWAFGISWIYFSDFISLQLSKNTDELNMIQNFKGWIFVTASAILIFVLSKFYFSRQRNIQVALEESGERLRLAVESAQQGIYDVHIPSGKVIVNDIYARMLGYDPDTFTESPQGWIAKLHPEDAEFTQNYYQDYINGNSKSYQIEFRLRTATNDYIWVLSSGKIIAYDDNGKPLRMMGTHINISQSKRLISEKDLFSNVFENSLNEIYLFDAQTLLFKQANKAAIDNLGYNHAEMLTLTPLDLKPYLSPDEFERLVEPLRNSKKEKVMFETIHQRKDGTQYPVEVHLQLNQFGAERIMTAIILDISERKKTESILKSEQERLAGIIEGTNVGTWEWYVQTGEIKINDRWAEIIGYTLAELTPNTIDLWFEKVHPDDVKASNELIQRHFDGEIEHYEMEARIEHKDGHWVWVLDRGKVTAWSDDGKPILMQGTHQDISKRKIDEARIIEQLHELRRWHAITLGREDRILELKREVNEILSEAGLPPKYGNSKE